MRLTKEKRKQLADLLNHKDVVHRIISDVALLDLYLGIGISMYFSNSDEKRRLVLHELAIERLSFSQKLSIFSKIPYEKNYKSLECIPAMRRLSRLRNHIAHRHYTVGFEKIFRDTDCLRLLVDYPLVYKNEFMKTKLQLWRILDTKEFTRYVAIKNA